MQAKLVSKGKEAREVEQRAEEAAARAAAAEEKALSEAAAATAAKEQLAEAVEALLKEASAAVTAEDEAQLIALGWYAVKGRLTSGKGTPNRQGTWFDPSGLEQDGKPLFDDGRELLNYRYVCRRHLLPLEHQRARGRRRE